MQREAIGLFMCTVILLSISASITQNDVIMPTQAQPPVARACHDQVVDKGDSVLLDGNSSVGSRQGVNVDPNVVGLWHMNEGCGNVIYDETANDNDGKINGATWTADGKFKRGLDFDGAEDYVDVGPNNKYGDGSAITVEVWFKVNNLFYDAYVLGSKHHLDHGGFFFLLRDTGRLDFYVYLSPTWRNAATQLYEIQPDQWYHAVGVYDGSIKLYLNGVLKEDYSWPGGFSTSSSRVLIGGVPKGVIFNGTIDEVAIWDRALSEQEILDYYDRDKEHFAGHEAKIVSYEWDFEGDGVYDYVETEANAPDGSFDGKTTFVYGDIGVYTATLRIMDEIGGLDTDSCEITVVDVGLDAGPDQTVNEGDLVELEGSYSADGGQPEDRKPVALWHMNEGSGSVIHDEIGNDNNGIINGATWTTEGRFGNSLSFDGIDDYVDVGPNNVYSNGSAITVEAWIKVDNLGSFVYVLGSRDQQDNGGFYFYLRDSGRLDFYVYFGPTWRNAATQHSEIQPGQWYYIVGVYDGSVRIYLNGVLKDVYPWRIGYDTSSSSTFIGGVPYSVDFNGLIDEVAIWDIALSAQEILDYYNSGKEHLTSGAGNGGLGTIVSYEWDFEGDGLYDYKETDANSPDGAFDGKTTHLYGDDGVFEAALRIEDDQGLSDTDTCTITVLNVDPSVTIVSATISSAVMKVEIGLRVAGRKFNDVNMNLFEDGKSIGIVTIERYPGSPDEQIAWIPVVSIDGSKSYSANVTFTPENPPRVGANPVWICIRTQNGSIKEKHHTFNVQQSKERDSERWNHVDPWEVDLNPLLTVSTIEITSHFTDPGSDDETLILTYGSQTTTVTYLNNPPNQDPYPSPEVKPWDMIHTTTFYYEGPGTVVLVVKDDDNLRLGVGGGIDQFDVG